MMRNKPKGSQLKTIAQEISEDTESNLRNSQFMKLKDLHILTKSLPSLLHGFKVSSENSSLLKRPLCQIS